jgi:hypothetical protein
MKRFALVSLLFALAISGYGFAATVTVTVTHADGTTASHSGTASTVGDACGTALSAAFSALLAGDVVQIPAVTACNIAGYTSSASPSWPANIEIDGMGPELTVLNSNDDLFSSSGNQVFQGLTIVSGSACCTDGSAITSSSSGTVALRNVNLVALLGGAGGVNVSGSLLLDHVVITSYINSVYSSSNGTITIRDSNLLASDDDVIEGGGTWNIYSTVISTTENNDEEPLSGLTGTVNLYAGTSVLAHSDGTAGCAANIYVYPGVYFNTSSNDCTKVTSQ